MTLLSVLGMASGRAPLVSRDDASALHHLLQPTPGAMESDLDRGDGHSQEVGDLLTQEVIDSFDSS